MREYEPPTTASILQRQNETPALRLLLAQRKLYSRAKRWQGVRWFGLVVLGVGAPFVSLLVPGSAVVVGAVAGLWLFVGRTLLTWLESRTMIRAASVQEELDQHLFQMPSVIKREEHPTPEDISDLVGDEQSLTEKVKKEKLLDWYPLDKGAPGGVSIAIAQRSNAAYTDRLIRTTVAVWVGGGSIWVVALIVWSSLKGVALSAFLLGVALPVLPTVLDVTEYVLNTWRAAKDRSDLARSIGARIRSRDAPIEGQDLLVWQERLFDLRRTTPQVPNWLYKLTRPRNELAMHVAADDLRGRDSAGN